MSQNLYINHSLWWAWAAVMWMGCEVAPKALSTRFIAGMWYLFTLIMVSSYTAPPPSPQRTSTIQSAPRR